MSTVGSLTSLSLSEVGMRIAAGELSPTEVTRAALERIDAVNPKVNAFLDVAADQALAAAEAAEKAIAAGYHLGPLHGVPLALKANVATRGLRTSAGSKILADNVPDEDATIAARLRAAGGIFLGKLNMHEFAYGVTTDNPHYGPARNPWDTERIPAGSSGGSGAAVAARLCFGAIGTDTGCSVRLPAAINGIVGLRPSIGRISNHGIVPLAWTLDTAGPMTRTVADCALMFEAIAGHDPRDRQTVPLPVEPPGRHLGRGLEGMRVALIEGFSLTDLQPDVQSAMEAAVETLEREGASMREVTIPDLEHSISALMTVDICEPSAYHGGWLRERPEEFGEDVRALLEVGEMYLATHYIHAQRYRTVMHDHFAEALADVDAIVTPTVPFTATPIGDTTVQLASGDEDDLIMAVMRYNALPPLTGMPALSVPCGFSSNELPIGMQLIGRAFEEHTLLRIGHGYQQATDWHEREPRL